MHPCASSSSVHHPDPNRTYSEMRYYQCLQEKTTHCTVDNCMIIISVDSVEETKVELDLAEVLRNWGDKTNIEYPNLRVSSVNAAGWLCTASAASCTLTV